MLWSDTIPEQNNFCCKVWSFFVVITFIFLLLLFCSYYCDYFDYCFYCYSFASIYFLRGGKVEKGGKHRPRLLLSVILSLQWLAGLHCAAPITFGPRNSRTWHAFAYFCTTIHQHHRHHPTTTLHLTSPHHLILLACFS